MRPARWLVTAVMCGVLLPAAAAGATTAEDPAMSPEGTSDAPAPEAGVDRMPAGDQATVPDSDSAEPLPGDAASEPLPRDAVSEPLPGDAVSEPLPGDPISQPPADEAGGSDADVAPGVAVPNPYVDYGFGAGLPLPAEPPPPVVVGSGADALIRPPDLLGDNDPTLLERYGAQGLSLGQDLPAPADGAGALSAVAAGLFGVATWLAQAVIAAFQWAFTVEVFAFLGDAVTTIVHALRELLYAPFVQAAVILAGGSLLWHGMVRRRGVTAVQGMVWTVVALTAAGVFFARPAAVIDAANHASTGLSRVLLAGVSAADPGSSFDDGVTSVATYRGHPADSQLRMAGDRFWRVFVYEPWLVLQFGDPSLGAPYGERVLASRTITAEERDAVAGDPDALAALVQVKRDEATALREEILADERMAPWFSGRRPVERAGVAMLALIGVIVGGVLLVLVAAAILLAQIALLLLVLLGPAVLLVGIHPGAGRVIAVRWAELAVGVLLRRVALGALLAVVLVVNGVLLEASYPLGWFVVVSMQALVVAAAVVYRKPFGRLFAPTTVPALEVGGVRRAHRSLQGQASRHVERWREARETPPHGTAGAPRRGTRPGGQAGERTARPLGSPRANGGAPPLRPRRDATAPTGHPQAPGMGTSPAAARPGAGLRLFDAGRHLAAPADGNGNGAGPGIQLAEGNGSEPGVQGNGSEPVHGKQGNGSGPGAHDVQGNGSGPGVHGAEGTSAGEAPP